MVRLLEQRTVGDKRSSDGAMRGLQKVQETKISSANLDVLLNTPRSWNYLKIAWLRRLWYFKQSLTARSAGSDCRKYLFSMWLYTPLSDPIASLNLHITPP